MRIVAALIFAAAVAAPAFAQDRQAERLKSEQDRVLKELDQKYRAERAKIQKEFETRLQSLHKPAPERGELPPALQRLANAVTGLLKRVEALEQRLSRLEGALRKETPQRKKEPLKRDRGF